MASLDPRLPVGDILAEPLERTASRARERSRRACASCSSSSGSSPSTRTATRRRSPADSDSASASRARWRSSRSCSCSTSRSRRSTCRFAPASSTCSSDSSAELGLSYLFVAHDLVGGPAHRRPRRRHVPRADRGDRRRRRGVRAARAPVHAGAALGDPDARSAQGARAAPDRPRGRSAEPGRSALGLPLPHPLPEVRGPRTRPPRQRCLDAEPDAPARRARTRRPRATTREWCRSSELGAESRAHRNEEVRREASIAARSPSSPCSPSRARRLRRLGLQEAVRRRRRRR